MIKRKESGFTLIELIIVVAIIGILVTIVIIAINPVRLLHDSQDAKMRSDLQQIKAAFQLYYNENRNYPSGSTIPSSGACWSSGAGCTGTVYMKQVPKSTSNRDFSYQGYNGTTACNSGTCSDYVIGAVLFTPSPDDGNTITKCKSPGISTLNPAGASVAANHEICND